MLHKTSFISITFEKILSQEIRVFPVALEKKVFYVTTLRDDKTFLEA